MILRFPAIGWHLDLLLRNRVTGRLIVHQVVLIVSNLALPAIIRQVLEELLVFVLQIHSGHIGHKEVRDQNAGNATDGRDDERPPVSLQSNTRKANLRIAPTVRA